VRARIGGQRGNIQHSTFNTQHPTFNIESIKGSVAIGTNHDFQGIFGGLGRQLDGGGGLLERKAMGDQLPHVEPARKDEAGDFALEGEIGGVAAEQIFFVHAYRGQIKAEGRRLKAEVGTGTVLDFGLRTLDWGLRNAFCMGEEHELSATAQELQGLLHNGIGGDGDDGGVQG
jgi:hypothetical protein